jgi:tripartite-type tricarboxylate transporter receptor subunit TctC
MRARMRLVGVGSLLTFVLLACAPATPGAAPAAPAAKPGRAAAPAAAQAAPQGDYFAGKTVTLLVNFSAGGPTDIFARMLAPYLERHVPGRPKLIVENKAGAGGVIGANQLYNSGKRDGLTLGIFTSPFGNQILDGEGVQYDAARFLWVGAVPETSISYASPTLGIRAARDVVRPSGEIVVGGLAPDSAKDLTMRTYLDALGVPYKYVTGYPGQAEVVLAFRRGEVNYGEDSLTSWMANVIPIVQEGGAVAVGQRGIIRNGQIVRDPRAADIPTLHELALELKGEGVRASVDFQAHTLVAQMMAVTRALVYPPSTSADVVALMREGMAATFADPEFQAAAEKQLGFQFEFLPGAESQTLAELIIRQPNDEPDALQHLKRLSKDKN